MAKKERVLVPVSSIIKALADVLTREGYIDEVTRPRKNGSLNISLRYRDGRPAIQGVKRISKLSRRLYLGVRDIRPVKRGHGLLILSTPAGILTGTEAREKRVGGEALFEIW